MNKNKLKGSSYNKQEEILNFLRSDLPEIFLEGKVDCKKLKQTLGEDVDDGNERYGLNWAGKSNCFRVIQEQTTATLKPAKDESVNFDDTQNLFIEGDNLEVLKVLQRSYYGKIKMIYIDPPYNTGNDFIYNDNFRKSKREEMIESGELSGDGDLTKAGGLSINRKDSNGHFHSDWLNMMYPRLFMARNLLRQDGVIFVSIDDNEVHNLRMIMNEIFGEENFLAQLIWKKKQGGGNDSKNFVIEHEYVICFAKNIEECSLKLDKKYVLDNALYPFKDKFGEYGLITLDKSSIQFSQSLVYEIKDNDGNNYLPRVIKGKQSCWRWSKEKVKNEFDKLVFKDGKVYTKYYRPDGITPKSLLVDARFGRTETGQDDIKAIFDFAPFSYPKPVSLIKHITEITTADNDLVLDFFAGSGTTAHAVMQLNSEDDGNRKFICVQLPELCDEESEAYKAGYKTIAEIGKERIRRSGKKIGEEGKNKVDVGFKVLKLDKSNFKVWQGKFENTGKLLEAMADFVDNVETGSKEENILFELILKSGLDLNVPVEEKEFGGDKYYSLDGGKLVVYLGKKITKKLSEEIQKAKPEKFICLDGCFQNNDQLKTNISLQLEQEKIDFKVI
ncbi:MAG: site-specific DNA-methyltransferase [Candidatus Moranbacteria bacterium]|nr:site-specific DNA-methyltransferase [Candidatus Moranbacteria bacterium]